MSKRPTENKSTEAQNLVSPSSSDHSARDNAYVPRHSTSNATTVKTYIRLARPKQWLKNVLLLAAPAAAGKLTNFHVFGLTLVAFATFCLGASGLYMLNDAKDAKSDRLHPKKRYRPIAAGLISERAGTLAGISLLCISVAISIPLGSKFVVALLVYMLSTVAYTLWFKHEPVLDISIVSFGFLLRAIAGGLATALPLSVWFLTVAAFGSLFMVSGKRYAEVVETGVDASSHRAVLSLYSPAFLNYVRALSSGVAITAYGLWAFEGFAAPKGQFFIQISTIPFVIGILIYALKADQGLAGSPEDVVLGDKKLLIIGAIWALSIAVGIYYPKYFN